MEAGDPERAIDYLESAKTYPERLGTGRPYDPDCRIQDALLSLALEDLGMTREAEETRERVVAYTLRHWSEPARHSLAAYRMLRRSGYQKQADRLLEEWESGSGNPAMRWLYLRASGRTNEARSLDNSRKTNPRHELTVSAADFMDRWAEQKH
jgi:hypothetical protein